MAGKLGRLLMGLLDGLLNQTATYWKFAGVNGFGDSIFEAPITISVRWEDESRLIADADGQQRTTMAKIWYDESLSITTNGFLALGDETVTDDPRTLINAYLVKEVNSTPDLSGTEEVKWVMV